MRYSFKTNKNQMNLSFDGIPGSLELPYIAGGSVNWNVSKSWTYLYVYPRDILKRNASLFAPKDVKCNTTHSGLYRKLPKGLSIVSWIDTLEHIHVMENSTAMKMIDYWYMRLHTYNLQIQCTVKWATQGWTLKGPSYISVTKKQK